MDKIDRRIESLRALASLESRRPMGEAFVVRDALKRAQWELATHIALSLPTTRLS